jgi:hypothetical protein
MSRQALGLTALAAAVMVAIFGIALTAQVTTNQAATEIYAIDLSGKAPLVSEDLSAQKRAAR